MIKILHLSYCDKNTGAGIAAKRIHSCICDYNDPEIKSFLRLNTNGIDNRNITYTKKMSLISDGIVIGSSLVHKIEEVYKKKNGLNEIFKFLKSFK